MTTEKFRIPLNWWNIFIPRRAFPIQDIIPCIINFYLQGLNSKQRQILAFSCHKNDIFVYLISVIEGLNNIRNEIPRRTNSIQIPTRIDFFRDAFPSVRLCKDNSDDPIRVSSIKILDMLNHNDELENLVFNAIQSDSPFELTANSSTQQSSPQVPTSIPFSDLSNETKRQVVEALHAFRIYTARPFPAERDPFNNPANFPFNINVVGVRNVYNENLSFNTLLGNHLTNGIFNDPLIVDAIRAFQREYILLEEEYCNGEINWLTALNMNRALRAEWYREQIFANRYGRFHITSGLRFPTESRRITWDFEPAHAFAGIDVGALTAGVEGNPIVAVMGGIVSEAQIRQTGSQSSYIAIRGDDGRLYRYLHARIDSRIRRGIRVEAGTQIGIMSNIGAPLGVHLHFEIFSTLENIFRVNPFDFFTNMDFTNIRR